MHRSNANDWQIARLNRNGFLWSGLLLAAFGCALFSSEPAAAETIYSQMQLKKFPTAQVFVFLFMMLGPLKIIPPFAQITRAADNALAMKIAALATLFSSAALLVAALVGESQLNSYGIPVPVLALAAGIILFLVALTNILNQFGPPAPPANADGGPPSLKVAMSPLAFPIIVTPYGLATLVVLLALSPDRESQMTIGALTAGIMVLNFVVMIASRHMMSFLSIVLPILGAVFGVIQVSLGLLIIQNSLIAMGVL